MAPSPWKRIREQVSSYVKPTDEITFQSHGVLTLGVEIELQMIDPTTYNLSSRAEELLERTASLRKVKPEFYLSTVEINTDKCNDVHEAEK